MERQERVIHVSRDTLLHSSQFTDREVPRFLFKAPVPRTAPGDRSLIDRDEVDLMNRGFLEMLTVTETHIESRIHGESWMKGYSSAFYGQVSRWRVFGGIHAF